MSSQNIDQASVTRPSDSLFDDVAGDISSAKKGKRYRKKRKSFSSNSFRFKSRSTFLQKLDRFLDITLRSDLIVGFVMAAFFFLYSVDFFALLYFKGNAAALSHDSIGVLALEREAAWVERAEAIKRLIGIWMFAFIGLISLAFSQGLYKQAKENKHLALLFPLLLASMYWSFLPEEVLTNVLQIGIGIALASCFALSQQDNKHKYQYFCRLVLLVYSGLHLASIVLFFYLGFELTEYPTLRRYGGFAGNPNSIGGQAVMGVFCAAYIFVCSKSRLWKIGCVVAIVLFAVSLRLSGSATGTVASVLTGVGVLALWYYSSLGKVQRLILVAVTFIVFLVGMGVMANRTTTEELSVSVVDSLGKESSLTGRIELWQAAIEAISEKPFLGWSYDSHSSVMAESRFHYDLNHYHNGFLDITVAGGFPLLFLVLFNLFLFGSGWWTASKAKRRHVYPILMVLLLLIVLNLTEYSLFRPLSVIFMFYLVFYFMLRFQAKVES